MHNYLHIFLMKMPKKTIRQLKTFLFFIFKKILKKDDINNFKRENTAKYIILKNKNLTTSKVFVRLDILFLKLKKLQYTFVAFLFPKGKIFQTHIFDKIMEVFKDFFWFHFLTFEIPKFCSVFFCNIEDIFKCFV